jgi:hypothetical protein
MHREVRHIHSIPDPVHTRYGVHLGQSWGELEVLGDGLEDVVFPLVGVVFWLEGEGEVVEVLVGVRDVLAGLADEDGGESPAKDHVGEGVELLFRWDGLGDGSGG